MKVESFGLQTPIDLEPGVCVCLVLLLGNVVFSLEGDRGHLPAVDASIARALVQAALLSEWGVIRIREGFASTVA